MCENDKYYLLTDDNHANNDKLYNLSELIHPKSYR